jgi:ubiquinone/menaquinone biosynthesis C-methylase UbiE
MYSSRQLKSWHPDRPVSKGATAYHDAVFNSSWIKDIMFEISRITRPSIKDNDTVVDFGAGTGTSAYHLMKNLDKKIKLWLVDNSPSWLTKAYELLDGAHDIRYFVLSKINGRYATLAETIGNEVSDHVISANTVHLIPDIRETFKGVYSAIKQNGTFTFQTGNFLRSDRPEGALMIDSTVQTVHDAAIDMINSDPNYEVYRNGLKDKIKDMASQRKLVFPDPRPIGFYLKSLEMAGFKADEPQFIPVKIRYDDWLNFLRVKRLQAGILPELGGTKPTPQEEKDRDDLITKGAMLLFEDLKKNNPLANEEYFLIECVYVMSKKISGGKNVDQ